MAFIITDECIACGSCKEDCPSDAIKVEGGELQDKRRSLYRMRHMHGDMPFRRDSGRLRINFKAGRNARLFCLII